MGWARGEPSGAQRTLEIPGLDATGRRRVQIEKCACGRGFFPLRLDPAAEGGVMSFRGEAIACFVQ